MERIGSGFRAPVRLGAHVLVARSRPPSTAAAACEALSGKSHASNLLARGCVTWLASYYPGESPSRHLSRRQARRCEGKTCSRPRAAGSLSPARTSPAT